MCDALLPSAVYIDSGQSRNLSELFGAGRVWSLLSASIALLRRDILSVACRLHGHEPEGHAGEIRSREGCALEPADVAKTIVDVASDKKASDVTMLDIREMSVIADYFVVCTGANPRQIQAISSAIQDKMDEEHIRLHGHEGNAESGWLLLDFGDVIVHIFGPMEREFYRLERIWSGAPTVVYLQ